jgi:SAM-dependent methyltransferase
MDAKEYYRTGKRSQWQKAPMREELMRQIISEKPVAVFEFGCGRGENLEYLKPFVQLLRGIDINGDEVRIAVDRGIKVFEGDEGMMGVFASKSFDISFTVGVMDHLEEANFQRAVNYMKDITKFTILCLETNETPGEYYYPHDYESLGFKWGKKFRSEKGDGAEYAIWRLDVNPE